MNSCLYKPSQTSLRWESKKETKKKEVLYNHDQCSDFLSNVQFSNELYKGPKQVLGIFSLTLAKISKRMRQQSQLKGR